MSKEKEYHELYDRLMAEVAALHRSNRRRIRSGMRMLVVVTVGLMLLMFLAEGNKVFTLMLWIAAMFGVASYLIAVEYADYELQKKLEYITQMEQESLGALLELPELPRMPRLPDLLRRGQREEHAPVSETESVPAVQSKAETTQAAPAGEAEAAWTAERIPDEVQGGTAQPGGAASPVLEKLLQDPEKLADDLLLLTKALQNLSDDLRRGSKPDGKGEVDA